MTELSQMTATGMKGYWFGRPGVWSTDICRMALAVVYLLMNLRNGLGSAEQIRAAYPVANYDPDGILMFLGPVMPSDHLIDVMILLSRIFPWLLLFGLFSRTSLWLTLITHLFLRTLIESFSTNWSHGFNVVFLAHLGFLFAPVGQVLSADSLIRRWRGAVGAPMRDGWWAVLLGQWNVALMFFSAFYWKALYNDKPPFSWAHWENMRNHLFTRYEWTGDPVPSHLEPVVASPLLCGLLGAANLIFQCLPFLSLFFVHRPKLRLLFGLAFIVEEIGLTVVMGLADLHWLPLIAFFVDWDHFLKRSTDRSTLPETRTGLKMGYALGLISLYLLFSLNVFGVTIGKNVFDLRAYPFSKFNMYSERLRDPEGKVFGMEGTTITIEAPTLSSSARSDLEKKLKRRFNGAHSMSLHELVGTLDQASRMANDSSWTGLPAGVVQTISIHKALFLFRTDTAHLALGQQGLLARWDTRSGTCLNWSAVTSQDAREARIRIEPGCGAFPVSRITGFHRNGAERILDHRIVGTDAYVDAAVLDDYRYLLITLQDKGDGSEMQLMMSTDDR